MWGKAPDSTFSPALTKAKGTWDAKKLDTWLADPDALHAGMRMVTKLPSAADRTAVIAYLRTKRVK